ncbi:hypothetical protein ASG89_23035 [Paenibacillus sp. Soil766]|uniref:hypothetical protein n=1 Tax=Paenibacillus sp. Soil766 TaxID=1736404 RepID=UPI00070EC400|nr:hypothetical protein [Paenibacillus sp. Soil766]KRF03323.1 hypothetical protein ASG89_23035 [Paenibacillus sp. Soil766]
MRYTAGWLVSNHILALTHFEPVVTMEDFQDIATDAHIALQKATQPFHLLIDNRIIAERTVATLDSMLKALPILEHTHLRWIVVVLPEAIKETAAARQVQRYGSIQLKFVDSLASAFQHLVSEDDRIDGGAGMEMSWIDWISNRENPIAVGEVERPKET